MSEEVRDLLAALRASFKPRSDVTRSQLTGDQFEKVDEWHESHEAGCCDIDGPYCAESLTYAGVVLL